MEQMLLPILMFAALGAMMYFGMRKQKRAVADTKRMQETLIPGTRVMTTSGLHGEITAVADDTIELEIAPGIRTIWVRAAVREVVVEKPAGLDDADGTDYDGTDYDGAEFQADSASDGYDEQAYHADSYDQAGSSDQVSLDKRRSGRSDVG